MPGSNGIRRTKIAGARKRIDGWFPDLALRGYSPKSRHTRRYNCIAWAAGETHRRWEPAPGYYWPKIAPPDDRIESLVLAFYSIGYRRSDKVDERAKTVQLFVAKVVLYADGFDAWTHAARQLPNGRWTSKLGDFEDIEHDSILGLEPVYADPRYLMTKLVFPSPVRIVRWVAFRLRSLLLWLGL
jgi:hypothetical protein